MKKILVWGCGGLVVLAVGLVGLSLLLAALGIVDTEQAAVPAAPQAAAAEEPAGAVVLTRVAEQRPAPAQSDVLLASVGERAEAGGVGLTVTRVETAAQLNDFMSAAEGKTYLVAEVLIENLDRDEAVYNPYYFKVKDGDAYEYQAAGMAPEPTLSHGELVRGDRVRGNVAFEVPASAAGFTMTYEPLVILGGYRAIRVDLGR